MKKAIKRTLFGTAAILVIVGVPLAALAALFVPIILARHTGEDTWIWLYFLLLPFLGYLVAAPIDDGKN